MSPAGTQFAWLRPPTRRADPARRPIPTRPRRDELSGERLGAEQQLALEALPDVAITIGSQQVLPDGSITDVPVPEGSRCPQWFGAALDAGWTADRWPRLDAVIWRESMCDPAAFRLGGRDESYGLLQLNMRAHRSWVDPLVEHDRARLFGPATNLTIGRQLFDRDQQAYGCGWQPWSGGCR